MKGQAILGVLVVLSLCLEGCGAKPSPTPTALPPSPTAARPTVTAVLQPTPAPQVKDTLVMLLEAEPDMLHPGLSTMFVARIIRQMLFTNAIVQTDTMDWLPIGVESVPALENGGARFVGEATDRHLEVTCTIKKGLLWHDGVPVTAKDAIYQWQLYMQPEFDIPDRALVSKVFVVKAVDDRTIVYQFLSEKQARAAANGTLASEDPRVSFAALKGVYAGYATQSGPVVDPLSFTICGWLPSHILASIAAKDQYSVSKNPWIIKPVGDGPYILKNWTPGQRMELEANPNFIMGAPKIKHIIALFNPDHATTTARMEKGTDDIITLGNLSADAIADLDRLASAGRYAISYLPSYMWEHVDLNTTKPPFDDKRVRQAAAYAINKQAIVQQAQSGKATLANSLLPAFSWAYGGDQIVHYDYDRAKAQSLLKEAGYTGTAAPLQKEGAQKLEIGLVTTDRKDRQDLARIVSDQLKAVGFGVNISILYGRGLFAPSGPLVQRTFDAAIYTWVADERSDVSGLYGCAAIPTSGNGYSGQNYPGWCSKQADALMRQATAADNVVSRSRARPLYGELQHLWTTDVPVIPLYHPASIVAARNGLKNWKPGPSALTPETWNCWEWSW